MYAQLCLHCALFGVQLKCGIGKVLWTVAVCLFDIIPLQFKMKSTKVLTLSSNVYANRTIVIAKL